MLVNARFRFYQAICLFSSNDEPADTCRGRDVIPYPVVDPF